MAEEKKNIFQKIGDAFSTRDEKEEAAKAEAKAIAEKQRAEFGAEAKKETEENIAEAKEQAEEAAKAKEVEEANRKRVEEAERYKAEAEAKKAEDEARKLADEEARKNAIIATHTVKSSDTLSHIALQYYGHATPPYYKLIYEFNKDIIGENMNIIVPGQVLRIPVLPDELK
ncbi:MAG: LysM peptidoglycan-binding domain-containing protein [Anaerolineaceae bacterium]